MKTTTAIIHEKRRPLADGTHPAKLRITFKGQRKYYTVYADPNKSGLTDKEFKKYRATFKAIEADAINVIKGLHEFSFEAFEKEFFQKSTKTDLFAAMAATAKELRNEGRIKTAITYETALKSLQTFAKADKLPFTKVTPEWLNKYEKWMLSEPKTKRVKEAGKTINIKVAKSETTVGIYLRNVRAAFNKAGIKEPYPFGRGKYEIPTGRNIKKALTLADIGKIFHYDAMPGSTREKYRDYWLLSYLCNGANIKDLAGLKYKDIDGEAITFIRAKTKETTKRGKAKRAIVVPLTVEIGRLIDRHGQKPATPETYLLPILRPGMTPKEKQVAIDNTVRAINEHIKIIAENIGISINVSTYTARHSFATVLKRSGASTEFISESLGHTDLKTTENYLADFEIDQKRHMAANLTNFDNGKGR